ncbi:DUF1801 domain-containing protein [Marinomonas agarivorans]|nr:DUF1801 domain-containing protein [Marinomonas agarivorans]
MQMQCLSTLTREYARSLPHHLRSDFTELLLLMHKISPDATFSIQLGMPLFELEQKPLYGITVRSGHLSIYMPETNLLYRFTDRLRPAHIGTDGLFFDCLGDMNINVIAELLSRAKGNFIYRKHKQNRLQ